ncbi:hypothetical protein PAMP_014260 [Pampus punctatissimus]
MMSVWLQQAAPLSFEQPSPLMVTPGLNVNQHAAIIYQGQPLYSHIMHSQGQHLSIALMLLHTKNRECENQQDDDRPYVKKPTNAFMLYMKEQRQNVAAELNLKGSAAMNTILGQRKCGAVAFKRLEQNATQVHMLVLEGLWGQDLRLRDSGLGVGVDVDVCPDEAPSSPVWGQLRTPPVICGGLSLALELPALIRQLRAAWRACRGGPQGPERSRANAWVEAEKEEVEEVKQDTENRSAHLEADGRLNTGHAGVFLAERRGSYPLIDLCIRKTSAQKGEVESGTRRKVKRLLSFQRYCHASRLLRGHGAGGLPLTESLSQCCSCC